MEKNTLLEPIIDLMWDDEEDVQVNTCDQISRGCFGGPRLGSSLPMPRP